MNPKPVPVRVPVDVPIDDPPPIMESWRNLYALVIASLAFDIFLLWLFTRTFA